MIKTGPMQLMKIRKPRAAFLLGPKTLLEQAQKMEVLPHGKTTWVELPKLGTTSAREIKVADGMIYEIEEAAATEIIEQFGLTLGEDGIANEAIEGA